MDISVKDVKIVVHFPNFFDEVERTAKLDSLYGRHARELASLINLSHMRAIAKMRKFGYGREFSIAMTKAQLGDFIRLRAAAGCKNGIKDLQITEISQSPLVEVDIDVRGPTSLPQYYTHIDQGSVMTIKNVNTHSVSAMHDENNLVELAKNINRIDALLRQLNAADTFVVNGVALPSKNLIPSVLVERQTAVKEMSRAIKAKYEAATAVKAAVACACKNS